MHLGIAVVYLAGEDDGPLIELQLARIRRHTAAPYTVYAGTDRLTPDFPPLLRRDPNVQICRFGEVPERGTLEASHYHTLLGRRALEDGVTHLAHLHMDSFPVRDAWERELAEGLGTRWALAGVAATEIGEVGRPRLVGLLASRAFHEEHGPVEPVAGLPRRDPAYQAYARQFLGHDSGDAYGYLLARKGLPWRRLERSNVREDHYLLGGLYGDVFFHLGAASRGAQRLPPNRPTHAQFRRLQWVRRMSRELVPAGVRAYVPDRFRALLNRDGERQEANRDACARIRERLLADPDGYLAYLRGLT